MGNRFPKVCLICNKLILGIKRASYCRKCSRWLLDYYDKGYKKGYETGYSKGVKSILYSKNV